MIEEKRTAIEKIAAKYLRRESAILPALYLVQRQNDNTLSEQDILDVAEILGTSIGTTYGVATYYTLFNKKPVGKYHLQVDTNISGMLMGANEIVAHLEKKLGITVGETTPDKMFTLSQVEDLGSSLRPDRLLATAGRYLPLALGLWECRHVHFVSAGLVG